jgi:hypothetical protein
MLRVRPSDSSAEYFQEFPIAVNVAKVPLYSLAPEFEVAFRHDLGVPTKSQLTRRQDKIRRRAFWASPDFLAHSLEGHILGPRSADAHMDI